MSSVQPAAIVVPMEGEFAPYRPLLPDLRRVENAAPWEIYLASAGTQPLLLVIAGPGPVNAAAATERLIARYDPVAVLHGGSAGAHRPDLLPGDVVLGSRYVIATSRALRAARAARGLPESLIRFRRDGRHQTLPHVDADLLLFELARRVAAEIEAELGPWRGPGWPADLPRRPGRVVEGVVASADAWTVDPDEIAALHEDFGAACEDMESAYVAQVCELHGLPFLAVRAISDNEAACALTPADVTVAIAEAGERAALILTALCAALPGG
jgi:adenosylhomocysteine nucleosidase